MDYAVRAARCSHKATDEAIYETLQRITEPLTRAWDRLERADRVVLKFNMNKLPDEIYYHEGRRRELVDDAVCRAVLRLLRERTTAELIATDTNTYAQDHLMGDDHNYMPLLKEFDVRFVDSNVPPFKTYEVPGGGLMFERYRLSACLDGAEVVSVAKMKNHLFMGVTLCMKNLFGLPPITPPNGRVRTYFHHYIRLSNVLPDLARITDPALNIVDALTGQKGREWGGEGRVCDALIAGDHVTATDAVAASLMGVDPGSDWPNPPFRRDRNHIRIAAESGHGTVDLDAIDYVGDVEAPLADFDSEERDPPERVASCLRTACEQGLYYQDRKADLVDRYRGQFIYLQEGDVIWSGPDPSVIRSHKGFRNQKPNQAMWLKLVDPDEAEGEHFDVYDRRLRWMAA